MAASAQNYPGVFSQADALQRSVVVRAGKRTLAGTLAVPTGARAIVLCGHDGGSGHELPQNASVARSLRRAGIATLVFDLLTLEEDAEDAVTGELRFDLEVLAGRIVGATDWVKHVPEVRRLRLGYMGARSCAAAALVAATRCPDVGAIVLRGGRSDTAGSHIERVTAPTLLIANGGDRAMVEAARNVQRRLRVPNELLIVPATSDFDAGPALDVSAAAARDWFARHLLDA